VPLEEEDNLFFVVSAAFMAYLLQIPEFTKSSYVDVATQCTPSWHALTMTAPESLIGTS
jgi:hypothetical protein